MKFIKLDLLTLLISLFILNSCKNQDNIGLGINSSNQLNGSLMDTSTIIINTELDDSIATNGLTKTPLAYLKDPALGTTEANIAFDLNLPSGTAYKPPVGTNTIDSAVLVLNYANGFTGDSLTSRYKASVHQLNERLFTGTTYYNTKKWAYNTAALGTQSFFSRTHDTIRITQLVAGGPDTLIRVRPQLRIRLDPNFINNNLFAAPANQLASNLVFKNTVKGLYVKLDQTQTGPGGTFFFAMDSSRVDVYFKTVNGSTVDTSLVQLPIYLHAANIKHVHTPQVQTELDNKGTGSRNIFYIQGLGGLRAKISFPYLKNITKTLGSDVLLNRAELVITPQPGSTVPFPAMPRISMYRYDLAHQRTLVEDSNPNDPRSFSSSGGFGGFFLPNQKEYHFLVTAYIQNLMRGISTDYGTYLGQGDGSIFSLSYNSTATADGRTIAVGSDKTSPYRIKLNIFYTKISK